VYTGTHSEQKPFSSSSTQTLHIIAKKCTIFTLTNKALSQNEEKQFLHHTTDLPKSFNKDFDNEHKINNITTKNGVYLWQFIPSRNLTKVSETFTPFII